MFVHVWLGPTKWMLSHCVSILVQVKSKPCHEELKTKRCEYECVRLETLWENTGSTADITLCAPSTEMLKSEMAKQTFWSPLGCCSPLLNHVRCQFDAYICRQDIKFVVPEDSPGNYLNTFYWWEFLYNLHFISKTRGQLCVCTHHFCVFFLNLHAFEHSCVLIYDCLGSDISG